MSKPVFKDIFALSGRRNRRSYVLYFISCIVVSAAFWAAAYGFQTYGDGDGTLAFALAAGVTFLLALSAWPVGAQRCRDCGWTGWTVFIALVPLIGWLFSLALFVVPGTEGRNQYGTDPLSRRDGRVFHA